MIGALRFAFVTRVAMIAAVAVLIMGGCSSSIPRVSHKQFEFPKGKAFLGQPKRPYEKLGLVRAKANYSTFDPADADRGDQLCRNYFNKAVNDLVKFAEDKGGDAVIEIRAVTQLQTGQWEQHKKPECSDEGTEGQSLAEGIAVKWN